MKKRLILCALVFAGFSGAALAQLPNLLKEAIPVFGKTAGEAPEDKAASDAAPSAAPAGAAQSASDSCDVVRGRTNRRIGQASFQPDKMMNNFYIKKDDAMRIYKEDGFTCTKAKELYDGYTSGTICFKSYAGVDRLYKFIEAEIKCKKDRCDQATLTCSSERNLH